MSSAIRAEHLTKRYRLRRERVRTLKEVLLRQYAPREEVIAVRDVSFVVDHGETVGIIGPNGSGKSTLLKLVAGTTRPTAGRLEVEGRVSALLELGVGFHPDFTGRENVYLTGSILGLTRKEMDRLMPSIEEFADIGRFFDAPIKTYSSGMYTRLAFTVAAHVDPDVLLVDEVLAVGDEYFQHRCMAKINELRAREKTILFVSHDLATVQRICDRAFLLDAGSIREEGEVHRVVDAYYRTVREREARAADSQRRPERWGSGRLAIDSIQIVDDRGNENGVFSSGAPATIQFRYRTEGQFSSVVFGVLIIREDGVAAYGSNTAIDGHEASVPAGEGMVCFRMPRLELLRGRYTFDVAAVSPDGAETYDYQARARWFSVHGPTREEGIARIPHQWEVRPDQRPRLSARGEGSRSD